MVWAVGGNRRLVSYRFGCAGNVPEDDFRTESRHVRLSLPTANRLLLIWRSGGTSPKLRKTSLPVFVANGTWIVGLRGSSLSRAARLAPFLAPSGKRSTDGIFGAQIRSR